jgi:hypothetical protein
MVNRLLASNPKAEAAFALKKEFILILSQKSQLKLKNTLSMLINQGLSM